MNDFFKAVRNFLTVFLPKQKCYSQHTIKSYKDALNLLIKFLRKEKKYSIPEIDFPLFNRMMICEFLEWLREERHCSAVTQNQRLNALKSFFRYTGMLDCTLVSLHMEIGTIPVKKEQQRLVKYLSEEALEILLREPNTTTPKGLRNRFIMILMYDTAARCQELLDLRLNDFIISGKTPFVYLTGKGSKTRSIPLMEKTLQHYYQYLDVFHPVQKQNPDDLLFYTVIHNQRCKMSPDNVASFMKIYGASASTKTKDMPLRIHPHQMRHTRAIHLYRSGMPLPLLSEFLGHSNINTTNIYAYADTEMKRAAIEKALHPTAPVNDAKTLWEENEEMILKLSGLG